jgi:tungstate transport system permease protein
MEFFIEGIKKAFVLVFSLNVELLEITFLSLLVSGSATLGGILIGVPLGSILARARFRGHGFIVSLINTGMGLPPVAVGLFVALLFWRSGPLGGLDILYTPYAMIIAQVIIVTPIVLGITIAGIRQLDPELRSQLLGLGASRYQVFWLLIREARLSVVTAIIAGFGGAISEVGAVMMVGGNIKDETRVLTTAIVLETRRGHFEMAIALSIILLVFAFGISLALTKVQQKI